MPESRRRRNRAAGGQQQSQSRSPLNDAEQFGLDDLEDDGDSLSVAYKAVMFGLMIIGLLWLITWYVTSGALPISGVGGWNIIIGFGIAMVGFFMTMRWK